jgi:hypothetical protein
MDHAVTFGEVLWSLAVFGGGVVVIAILLSILTAIGRGFSR